MQIYPAIKITLLILWFLLSFLKFLVTSIYINYGLTLVTTCLILDLLINLIYSKDRLAFCKENWFELLSLVPVFRVFKLGKFLKMLKFTKKTYSGIRKIKKITNLVKK